MPVRKLALNFPFLVGPSLIYMQHPYSMTTLEPAASSFLCYREVYETQPLLHGIVLVLRMCYGEVYRTLHVKKMADLVSCSKFITLNFAVL